MNIYTKTGDAGDTGLFGGKRLSKGHVRIEAYGSVDELNAQLGLCSALLQQELAGSAADADAGAMKSMATELEHIQHTLFIVGSHLSTPYDLAATPGTLPLFKNEEIEQLEQWIDEKQAVLPELKNFILPSGTVVGASLHVARTVCRRAERATVRLHADDPIRLDFVMYLNRLSDYLFVAARFVNHVANVPETPWISKTAS